MLLCVVDVDECVFAAVTGLQACGSGAVCTNTPGSFTCSCPAGFVLALHGHDCVGAFGVCGIHLGGGGINQAELEMFPWQLGEIPNHSKLGFFNIFSELFSF